MLIADYNKTHGVAENFLRVTDFTLLAASISQISGRFILTPEF